MRRRGPRAAPCPSHYPAVCLSGRVPLALLRQSLSRGLIKRGREETTTRSVCRRRTGGRGRGRVKCAVRRCGRLSRGREGAGGPLPLGAAAPLLRHPDQARGRGFAVSGRILPAGDHVRWRLHRRQSLSYEACSTSCTLSCQTRDDADHTPPPQLPGAAGELQEAAGAPPGRGAWGLLGRQQPSVKKTALGRHANPGFYSRALGTH